LDLPVLLSVAVFRIPLAAGKYSFPQPTEGMKSLLKFYPGRLERMALLTVEVEVNGDSKSTNERGPTILGYFVGLVVPVQEILVQPWLF
jgi:hypothetical protein